MILLLFLLSLLLLLLLLLLAQKLNPLSHHCQRKPWPTTYPPLICWHNLWIEGELLDEFIRHVFKDKKKAFLSSFITWEIEEVLEVIKGMNQEEIHYFNVNIKYFTTTLTLSLTLPPSIQSVISQHFGSDPPLPQNPLT